MLNETIWQTKCYPDDEMDITIIVYRETGGCYTEGEYLAFGLPEPWWRYQTREEMRLRDANMDTFPGVPLLPGHSCNPTAPARCLKCGTEVVLVQRVDESSRSDNLLEARAYCPGCDRCWRIE